MARPDLRISLVESLARRTVFLTEVVEALDLPTVEVVRARAEECVNVLPPADVVTARAVAPLDRLASWCLPLAGAGGAMLAIKGSSAAAEIDEHGAAVRRLGGGPPELLLCGERWLEEPVTVVRVPRLSGGPRTERSGSSGGRAGSRRRDGARGGAPGGDSSGDQPRRGRSGGGTPTGGSSDRRGSSDRKVGRDDPGRSGGQSPRGRRGDRGGPVGDANGGARVDRDLDPRGGARGAAAAGSGRPDELRAAEAQSARRAGPGRDLGSGRGRGSARAAGAARPGDGGDHPDT